MQNEPPIDAEVVNPNQALAVVPQQSVSLFRTDEPADIVKRASAVASSLKDVIAKQGLISNISGKQYPKCEAWTLCGTMLGVFPVLCWSRPIEDGWEARVEAKTRDGAIVGAAEAQCLRSERNWSNRDDFALRSMAQTRATSKALRMPLGFIMSLAGYQVTPAEEMTHDDDAPQPHRPAPTQPKPATKPTPPAQPPRTIPKRDAPIADAETRKRMILQLQDIGEQAWNYFVSKAMLHDNETLDQLPLEFVPTTKFQFLELRKSIEAYRKPSDDDQIPGVEVHEPEQQEPEMTEANGEAWREYPLPYNGQGGKVPKGTPLGKLEKNYLYGLFKNVKVATEFNGKPLSEQQVQANKDYRAALDAAGAHYEFK
jgi:hypothetical protein